MTRGATRGENATAHPFPVPPGTAVALSETDFHLIRGLLFEKAGIALKESKIILVQNRLRKRLKRLDLKSYRQYYDYVRAHEEELPSFLDALTTNETFFFREEKHWEFLRTRILPQVARERTAAHRSFSVWSAASSTGEELYTTALVCLENLPNASAWKLRFLGSDLNTEVIAKARAGTYSSYAVRAVPPPLLKKYFHESRDETRESGWQIGTPLRSLCRFDRHNLLEPFPSRGIDLVLCRNVFIYFSAEAKTKVLANLIAATAVGGYIFFSHTESILDRPPGIEQVQPSIYRRIR